MATSPIRLLATDLDGTLLGVQDEYPLYGQFLSEITRLRQMNGAVWAICTGRSLPDFKRVFGPLRAAGLVPDFVIISHAYIHSVRNDKFVPHVLWNFATRLRGIRQNRKMERLLHRCHMEIMACFRHVRTVHKRPGRLCLRGKDPQIMMAVAQKIRDIAHEAKDHGLLVFDHLTQVDVRVIPFTKGIAVAELASHLGISRLETLAIGDGLNDIPMLNGTAAAMSGCPSSAHVVTMMVVNETGGHIAQAPYLAGTIEALRAWQDGRVASALPSDWAERMRAEQSNPPRVPNNEQQYGCRSCWEGCLFLAAAGTVVLTLLAFGVLGPVSRLFTQVLDRLMEKLLLLVGQ